MRAVIAGGGLFGLVAALSLRQRSHDVVLVDPGPLPHPLAASTDISKAVRIDYGSDEFYMELGEQALEGWRRWNAEWAKPLFHETGIAFLSSTPMTSGTFEGDSFERLRNHGHQPERLEGDELRRRYPAFRPGKFVDGYYNPVGGWAESGQVILELARRARAAGVEVRSARATAIAMSGEVVSGVIVDSGDVVAGDAVVVAAGSWTTTLVPELSSCLRATGQPVFHLAPASTNTDAAHGFPVFGADISETGWYGFPSIAGGPVKIANHGPGRRLQDPQSDPRVVDAEQERALRSFLTDYLPGLSAAPIANRRLCVYSDTLDGHFWIAAHPRRSGLFVAAGGSGHAFKFAPILGDLIGDLVEGAENPSLARFGWRRNLHAGDATEQARFHPELTGIARYALVKRYLVEGEFEARRG